MRRILIALFAAVSAVGFAGGTALADPAANVSFFHGGDGTAHWAPQQGAIVLSETTTPGAYAGAMLMHVASTAPAVAPNFTQVDTTDEASGGSPRLVLLFGDGGTVYGYRLAMSTATQSDALHWDSTGGASGFIYNGDYSVEVADHNGSPVVAAYVVTDSGWEGQSYTNFISDITYGDSTYAG
jgi:hypothetical protein